MRRNGLQHTNALCPKSQQRLCTNNCGQAVHIARSHSTPCCFNEYRLGGAQNASHANAGRIAKLSKSKELLQTESITWASVHLPQFVRFSATSVKSTPVPASETKTLLSPLDPPRTTVSDCDRRACHLRSKGPF